MRHKLSKIKEIKNDKKIKTFNVKGKKNNQRTDSGGDRKIQTLGYMNNVRNSVNLISGIIRLPSGSDFSVCIGGR